MSINMVQDFSVEVDSIKLLRQYLELALSTVLNSTEEITIKVYDHNDNFKTLCYPSAIYNRNDILPILLIGGWYKPEEGKENSFFAGYRPWESFTGENSINDSIRYIIKVLNENLPNLSDNFLKECGDGYADWFNHNDGSIDVGYKLISNQTFPNSLSLSLVHMYYGK